MRFLFFSSVLFLLAAAATARIRIFFSLTLRGSTHRRNALRCRHAHSTQRTQQKSYLTMPKGVRAVCVCVHALVCACVRSALFARNKSQVVSTCFIMLVPKSDISHTHIAHSMCCDERATQKANEKYKPLSIRSYLSDVACSSLLSLSSLFFLRQFSFAFLPTPTFFVRRLRRMHHFDCHIRLCLCVRQFSYFPYARHTNTVSHPDAGTHIAPYTPLPQIDYYICDRFSAVLTFSHFFFPLTFSSSSILFHFFFTRIVFMVS